MVTTLDSIPRKVTFSNLPEEQNASKKKVESSISDKKIRKIVLSTLKETSLSEFDPFYSRKKRLGYLTTKCLAKFKITDSDQETLITRIHHFIKTSKDINQETLDCLFLKGNWLDKIDALAPRHESGYVAYVAKLCEADVEAFRAKIKNFSRKELVESIKDTLNNEKKMEEMWGHPTPEQKLRYLDNVCYDSLMEPQYKSFKKVLDKLKTKKFSVEELENKGLPGSRNMLPDIFEDGVVKKALYESMTGDISRQFLQKELDHLYKRIKMIIRASPTVMKELGFEVKTK